MWKTLAEKYKITGLNDEMYLKVTDCAVNMRKTGKNVTWSWVQENQQIPYSEFSKFYEELSTYTETKRDEYLKLEIDCQNIAQRNNTMLDTFPNNIYNRWLGCKRIEYEYGFTSNKTQKVFKDKLE